MSLHHILLCSCLARLLKADALSDRLSGASHDRSTHGDTWGEEWIGRKTNNKQAIVFALIRWLKLLGCVLYMCCYRVLQLCKPSLCWWDHCCEQFSFKYWHDMLNNKPPNEYTLAQSSSLLSLSWRPSPTCSPTQVCLSVSWIRSLTLCLCMLTGRLRLSSVRHNLSMPMPLFWASVMCLLFQCPHVC